MKKIPRIGFFLLFFGYVISAGNVYSQTQYAGQLPPVTIGSSCVQSTVYHVSATTKMAWQASVLLAVPDGTALDEWSDKEAFLSTFSQAVGTNTQISNMANAVLAIWPQFFQTSAVLYGTFQRSVNFQKYDIACISATWAIVDGSQIATTENEDSEWIRIIEEAVGQENVSVQEIVDRLSQVLENVNSQPGADTRPHYSYTSTE